MATTVAFRALDDAGKLPDNYVNPAEAGDAVQTDGPKGAPAELRLDAKKEDGHLARQ